MEIMAYARVTLSHQGVEYAFDYPHATDGDTVADVEAGMRFQWTDGNYGCDCNRIPFIEAFCGVDLTSVNDLVCDNTVSLVKLEAVYPDGTATQVHPDPHRVAERLAAFGLVTYGEGVL